MSKATLLLNHPLKSRFIEAAQAEIDAYQQK
jgi:hypothetical protein